MLELINILQAAPGAVDLVRDGLALLRACVLNGRDPSAAEMQAMEAGLKQHLAQFHRDIGQAPPD